MRHSFGCAYRGDYSLTDEQLTPLHILLFNDFVSTRVCVQSVTDEDGALLK